jgi:AraC-like DNA-binding protein
MLAGPWDDVLDAGRVLLLCFIGWYGIRQAPVFVPGLEAAVPESEAAEGPVSLPAQLSPAAPQAAPNPAKYARSGLTDAAAELIAKRLDRRMATTRDYLECELTLGQLAERIGTSPQWLSQYLNHVVGQSFFDYINGLRVLELQRALGESANASRPLLELAFAAGFNSKSTFNAAFKKHAGCAPSVWRSGPGALASEPIG